MQMRNKRWFHVINYRYEEMMLSSVMFSQRNKTRTKTHEFLWAKCEHSKCLGSELRAF